MPLFSMLSFHSLSLLIRSSSVSAITTSSSAYNNSYGKVTLNFLHKSSMTITNKNGLNAEPRCIPAFTSKLIHRVKVLHNHLTIIDHFGAVLLCQSLGTYWMLIKRKLLSPSHILLSGDSINKAQQGWHTWAQRDWKKASLTDIPDSLNLANHGLVYPTWSMTICMVSVLFYYTPQLLCIRWEPGSACLVLHTTLYFKMLYTTCRTTKLQHIKCACMHACMHACIHARTHSTILQPS